MTSPHGVHRFARVRTRRAAIRSSRRPRQKSIAGRPASIGPVVWPPLAVRGGYGRPGASARPWRASVRRTRNRAVTTLAMRAPRRCVDVAVADPEQVAPHVGTDRRRVMPLSAAISRLLKRGGRSSTESASQVACDPTVVNVVDPRAWATVAVVARRRLVSLDTMVNIAFPAITASFGIEVSDIQWLVTTYVLTFASLLLAAGRLSDVVRASSRARRRPGVDRVGRRLVWHRSRVRLVPGGASAAGCGRRAGDGLGAGAGHVGRPGACAESSARLLPDGYRGRHGDRASLGRDPARSGPPGGRCTCCGSRLPLVMLALVAFIVPARSDDVTRTRGARRAARSCRARCWWGPGSPPRSWR